MARKRLRSSYRPPVAVLAIAGLLLLAALLGVLLWDTFRSEARIAGQAPWPYGLDQTPLEVFRNGRGFADAAGFTGDFKSRHQMEQMLMAAFGVKAVNFNRQMLLIVRGGPAAGGNDVLITRAVFDKGRNALVVHWALRPRAPAQPGVWRPAEPAALVLLERFDGDVTLAPVPDP